MSARQQDLFRAPPARSIEREIGELRAHQAAAAVERHEDPDFRTRARAFVLELLAKRGEASSEDLTDACVAAGITAREQRAFGAVYSALARRRQIVFVRFCERRKGHGTGGGRVWRLARAGESAP